MKVLYLRLLCYKSGFQINTTISCYTPFQNVQRSSQFERDHKEK